MHTGAVGVNPKRCYSPRAYDPLAGSLSIFCVDENGVLVAYQ